MSKVFLHVTSTPDNPRWENTPREFLRLPTVGEYLATESTGPWYKIVLVVHCPFEAEYAAEVYAVKVDHSEVLKGAVHG
jgi:hypothetical protein